MSPVARGGLIVAVLCVAVALIYWFGIREEPAPAAPAPVPAPAAPSVAAPAAPRTEPSGPPLPALADSDPELLVALSQLFGAGAEKFILRPGVVHRIVATIDNLPTAKVPLQVMPVKPVGGAFGTGTAGGPGCAAGDVRLCGPCAAGRFGRAEDHDSDRPRKRSAGQGQAA